VVVSPEAWLSTWSHPLARRDPRPLHMMLPALVIDYAGDNAIYPSDTEHIVARRLHRRAAHDQGTLALGRPVAPSRRSYGPDRGMRRTDRRVH
jgi:hypothetical protein